MNNFLKYFYPNLSFHDCLLLYSLVKYSARYYSRKDENGKSIRYSFSWALVIHLIAIFLELSQACAIDSPATFLTGNHVVQIGFDQISPSGSSTRKIWEQDYFHTQPLKQNNELKIKLTKVQKYRSDQPVPLMSSCLVFDSTHSTDAIKAIHFTTKYLFH